MPVVIGSRPTSAGLDLLTRVIAAGATLTFTRGAFGDSIRNGSYFAPSAAEQLALTALIHERLSLPIADLATSAGNAICELLVRNVNVSQTFQVREVGLFARDPDTNQEILYAYTAWGDAGFILPAPSGGIALEFYYRFISAVGAAENVTAVIDRSNLYTTLERFNNHINATNPHPNFEVPETYTLPTASSTTKGGIKIGTNLYMSGDSLNAANSYTLPTASSTTMGGIKIGANLFMTGDSLNAADPYVLPTASPTIKGGAKTGYGLIMNGDTLNVAQSLTGGLADSLAALEVRVAALEQGGSSAIVAIDIALDTSPNHVGDFTLSGAYSLTSDGFFTLN